MSLFPIVLAGVLAGGPAYAQNATIMGQVMAPENGQPVGFATISVLSQGTQYLAGDKGRFVLTNVPVGTVRLRFKRMGFTAKDTTFSVSASDTVQLRIEMTRLVIALPALVVSGTCTNEMPFQNKSVDLAELFDQVNQNAERMKLFARITPVTLQAVQVRSTRDLENHSVPMSVDTIERGLLPEWSYRPKQVLREKNRIMMPELPHFADTAFTNNHCFHYAGQTRFGTDSVVAVDFEPVPWLDKEVDLKGTIYLRIDDYQLVGVRSTLNRIPSQIRRVLKEYTVLARFNEVAPGIPVLAEIELENRMVDPKRPGFFQTTNVFNVRRDNVKGALTDSTHQLR
ncbi:MAG: carboxypeptidase-like regulatory domain-containing protein [Gemmatimonadaceae bacterium]